jgi:hypothetical protein
MSVARDGTGGLVYLKDVGGVAHVFVARLAGSFQAAQQIDAGLAGPSSQPVVAAGNGGLLLIGFVNSGTLYVVDRASAGTSYSAPIPLSAEASNPAIAITNLGKAYLAFTATGGGGHDVRCAYYQGGRWSVESGPLDAAPADDAGAGGGRPAVAAPGDGVGIVAWGENGHIYSRRVWGTSPSVVFERADTPSLNGWNEVGSSAPAVGSGGDSSYAAVAFQETLASGGQQQSRVFARRLHGSQYEGIAQADDLGTPGPEGALQPGVAVAEYGQGFVTSARDASHQLYAMRLNNNDTPGPVQRIDTLPNTAPPFAVPAPVGLHDTVIAWQETPPSGSPQIRASFYDGSTFWPEQVLSSSSPGATDASDGLVADGDSAADVAVAWVQGAPGSRAIVIAQMFQPPGSFGATTAHRYVHSARPTLSWSAPRELWGQLRYSVSVDGRQIGQTTGTSLRVPNALAQGSHRWQVTAVNPAGQSATDRPATLFVDSVAPKAHVTISGTRRAGSRLHLLVRDRDPRSRGAASGIKQVTVKWGDHSSSRIHHDGYHTYRAPGLYRITVTVKDRASNKRKVTIKVKISGGARAHG